jgi:hypothetical protein
LTTLAATLGASPTGMQFGVERDHFSHSIDSVS